MVSQPAAELGLRDFARHIGKKQSYITQLKQQGRLVLTADGKVRVAESLARIKETSSPEKFAVQAYHAANREGVPPDEPCAPAGAGSDAAPAGDAELVGNIDYQTSRARREFFEAKAKERDYQLSIGQLLRAEEVLPVVAGAAATLRQRLETLAHILGQRLAAEQDEAACQAILADEFEHALEDLSRQFARIAKDAPRA